MSQPEPVQPELPFETPPARDPLHPSESPSELLPSPSWQAQRARTQEPLPPSIYEQIYARLRALPWTKWRAHAKLLSKEAAIQGARFGKLAVVRGTPYMMKLAETTAKSSLFRTVGLMLAKAIHAIGLPAVVFRTSIQLTLIYRSGLTIDEAVFFRLDDPAAYVVYETPPSLSTALAIAFVPTVVLLGLALICLWPALTPRSVLHLPLSMLTALQLWLGISLAAHALPNHEEAQPVADQARARLEKADPVGLVSYLPALGVAFMTRFGSLAPAIVCSAAVIFFASRIFQ
jgi:hypothetical protein